MVCGQTNNCACLADWVEMKTHMACCILDWATTAFLLFSAAASRLQAQHVGLQTEQCKYETPTVSTVKHLSLKATGL